MKYSLFILLLFFISSSVFGQSFPIPGGSKNSTVIIYGGNSRNKDFSFQKTSEKFLYRDMNTSHLKKNYNPKSSDTNFVLYVAKNYSPDAYYILSRCKYDIMKFHNGNFSDNRKDSIMASFQTMVHECHHSLDSTVGPVLMNLSGVSPSVEDLLRGNTIKMPTSIYIKKQDFLFVHPSEIFPSKKILPFLPDYLKVKNLPSSARIDIYINSKTPYDSTQNLGIYGLLEEFSAYYQGMKAMHDIRKYYANDSHHSSKKTSAISYLALPFGNIYSGREFKIFILTYLTHAKRKHPEVYKGILNNESFIKAFFEVDQNFENLIIDVKSYRKELLKNLKKLGADVKIDEDIIKIDKQYIYDYLRFPEAYEKALNQKELKDMMKTLEAKRK
ncbi:MAG: hypothetical protein OEZ34_04190 [Spirochaetia bacterium]|nr:hypothetical protein [Spirochaetia bacterium]